MAIRFRAHLHFTVGSGMAQWVADQMSVRMDQAFHLREGDPNAELSEVVTDIVTTGPTADRRENVHVNVFWPDDQEALAEDTRVTLSDASVTAHLLADTTDRRSWMDWHWCNHDAAPPTPCPKPDWSWP